MHWVLQSNLYSEENFEHLVTALERFGLAYSIHKVIPFIGELEPAPVFAEGTRVITMGSYTLARAAARFGWQPGAFLDNLDFAVQHARWGDRMFNADAQVLTIATVPPQIEPFFMRPTLDTKTFTGEVMDWPTFAAWRERILAIAPDAGATIDADTSVMICRKKTIHSETRTWIIDGRVVTASGYKVGTLKRYTRPHEVDDHITQFAAECAAVWSPNRAYVLDVFDTPDGPKIGEVNNLNSAGWYRADMAKLVMALEEMPPD
jgi:hypothetical protein